MGNNETLALLTQFQDIAMQLRGITSALRDISTDLNTIRMEQEQTNAYLREIAERT